MPLLAADAGQGSEVELAGDAFVSPEDVVSATEGGSPSGLSAIPEETDSDFSGYAQLLTLAARREVEGAGDPDK